MVLEREALSWLSRYDRTRAADHPLCCRAFGVTPTARGLRWSGATADLPSCLASHLACPTRHGSRCGQLNIALTQFQDLCENFSRKGARDKVGLRARVTRDASA